MEDTGSDVELVRRARAGESSAYGDLVRRWAARITGFCHAKAARAGLAEDLAQETFLRGFRAIGTLEDPSKFGPWLCGIAQRTFLDWQKAKQSAQLRFGDMDSERDPADFSEAGAADGAAERSDERDRLLHQVESLPEIYRETLMLFYYEEMSYRQIADLLGLSAAAVNARLTKARSLLRERLGERKVER